MLLIIEWQRHLQRFVWSCPIVIIICALISWWIEMKSKVWFILLKALKDVLSSLVVFDGNQKFDCASVVRTFTFVITYHTCFFSSFMIWWFQVYAFLEDISNSLANSATMELSMLKDLKVRMIFVCPFGLAYFMADSVLSFVKLEKRGRRFSIWSWGSTILCEEGWRTAVWFWLWSSQAILSSKFGFIWGL